jgi:hypothetical protein
MLIRIISAQLKRDYIEVYAACCPHVGLTKAP